MSDIVLKSRPSFLPLPKLLTDPLGLGFTVGAGIVATLAFDLFGQWLAPALGYSRLAPAPLASQVLQVMFGPFEAARAAGNWMHWFTGVFAYAFGYVLIALPVARKIMPALPGLVVATVYGAVLWIFALYVMAHLVAGNPAFLGFGELTWVALVGHMVYAWALAAVLALQGR
ncbi:MAG: hypothetical protein AAF580_02930 [Pseudomonadota bacterium]